MGLIELIDASDEGYPKRPKKKAAKSTKAKAKPEVEEVETLVEESAEESIEIEAPKAEGKVAEADASVEAKEE